MNQKKYIFDYIPEELDQNQIDCIIGQKSPVIRPKLDDTIPSILNLSERSSIQNTYKDDSFNNKINKNFSKASSLAPLANKKSNFVRRHYKSLSNEVFGKPNFLNIKGKEKNNQNNEDDDNSSYYGGDLNFDGVINFCGDDDNKEENEDIKKGLLIENENEIENKIEIEDDIHEGFNILNMLQKGKPKDNN